MLALESGDVASTSEPAVLNGEPPTIEQRSGSKLVIEDASGPGVVFLAEAKSDGWRARLDGVQLEKMGAGWGNGFEAPDGARGELVVDHPRGVGRFVWLLAVFVAWLAVLGAAFGRTRHTSRSARRTA